MDDERKIGADILIGNPTRMPTDEVLQEDAGSLVSQYIHFWNPGEVECIVILARPDSKEAIYATSVLNRDRVTHLLNKVHAESVLQRVLVRGHKLQG